MVYLVQFLIPKDKRKIVVVVTPGGCLGLALNVVHMDVVLAKDNTCTQQNLQRKFQTTQLLHKSQENSSSSSLSCGEVTYCELVGSSPLSPC